MGAMTPRQKQGILAICQDPDGNFYYNDKLDGKWGPKSQAAAERFLKDFAGEETATDTDVGGKTFWDTVNHFRREEFRCKCGKYCNGFPVDPDETTVRYADAIRERLGVPLNVNSGIRCETHNANVGGVKNSRHVLGKACDLAAPKGITPEKMASVAEEVIGNTGGIGIYDWGIHIDSRSVKARWNG